jgi:hypothetical protein
VLARELTRLPSPWKDTWVPPRPPVRVRRKVLVLIRDGSPRASPAKACWERSLSKTVCSMLLSMKESVAGGQMMQVGGETHFVPEKARVSVRRLGSWMELEIAATNANGDVHSGRMREALELPLHHR